MAEIAPVAVLRDPRTLSPAERRLDLIRAIAHDDVLGVVLVLQYAPRGEPFELGAPCSPSCRILHLLTP